MKFNNGNINGILIPGVGVLQEDEHGIWHDDHGEVWKVEVVDGGLVVTATRSTTVNGPVKVFLE